MLFGGCSSSVAYTETEGEEALARVRLFFYHLSSRFWRNVNRTHGWGSKIREDRINREAAAELKWADKIRRER